LRPSCSKVSALCIALQEERCKQNEALIVLLVHTMGTGDRGWQL